MWHGHMMEYYSATKRKAILPHATIFVNLENVMLNEICRPQKDVFCDCTYASHPEQSDAHGQKAEGWGRGEWGFAVSWGQSLSWGR